VGKTCRNKEDKSQVDYYYGTLKRSNGRNAGLNAYIYVEQCVLASVTW